MKLTKLEAKKLTEVLENVELLERCLNCYREGYYFTITIEGEKLIGLSLTDEKKEKLRDLKKDYLKKTIEFYQSLAEEIQTEKVE